jgi:hypothetical protein
MAEEATVQEELEPIIEPEGDDTPTPAEPDPLEAEARAKGWRPEEEYDGPSGGFVSADEFLKREPLFDKIKNQSKELKRLQKTMEAVSTQFRTQVEAQVKLRLKELQAQKREAIKDQDVELVEQIDAEIDAQKNAVPKPEAQVPDEVTEWVSRHSTWFDKDVDMTDVAVEASRRYIANHPGDVAGSLEAAERAVKRQFPDNFKEKKPARTPSPTSSGGEPKDTGGKQNYSVSRLSEDQKLVYNQWVKRDKFLSHEEFFKGLEEQGELS